MEAGVSTARKSRAEHRHDLRTLTYLTVNHTTAGVIRNLNQSGMGAQLVNVLHTGQHVRLQFDLRNPRLRVETAGEVVWASSVGQCGIRFLDLPGAMRQHLNAWILGDLLESVSLRAAQFGSMFSPESFAPLTNKKGAIAESTGHEEEIDGLMLSGTPAKVIQLPLRPARPALVTDSAMPPPVADAATLDWMSQPLSPRAIARLIDLLAVIAAFLLFAFIFLSVTRDAPSWPFTMAAVGIAAVVIVYWGFFWTFGGESLGTRIARKAGLEGSKLERR